MRRFAIFAFDGLSIRWPLVIGVVLATSGSANPQGGSAQPASPAAFDVASVKPQPWTEQGSVGITVRGNTLDAEHVPLSSLVTYAYNLRDNRLSGGPPWVRCDGVLSSCELYQVMAKAPEGPPTPMDVFRRMLQQLLADRFKLQIHHREKELPVYNLVARKGGPKLRESPADAEPNFVVHGVGQFGIRLVATHKTMQQLVDSGFFIRNDRPIFDKTGLAAAYDFTLEFAVQDTPVDLSPGQAADRNDFPLLRTALQEQLGLTLEPGSAPFDTIVIDHVERPTAN